MVSQCCSVLPLRPDLWMALVKNVVGALKEDLELSCARIKKLQSSDAGKRKKIPRRTGEKRFSLSASSDV